MQRAVRRSDGKFWVGGGGGGSGDKENSSPNLLNNASSPSAEKENILLTNKNVLRPKKACEEQDGGSSSREEKNSRRMSAPHLQSQGPRSLSPNLIASPQAPANRSRHIRFDLPDSSECASSPNETLTPPPKEFRRSDYKTLRANRCLSTVVTERERAVLRDLEAERLSRSPRPPAGIVRSMCRFYNSQSVEQVNVRPGLNRSSSFSGGPQSLNVVVVDHGHHSPSSSASSDEASCPSSSEKASSVSPGSETEGGGKRFGLFRSRSWSLRRKRGQQPKRCSPSYSTKSQDSGFSDTESKGGAAKTAVLMSSKSTRSTGTSMREEDEDEEDPNLTQMPSSGAQRKVNPRAAHENQLRQRQWLHQQQGPTQPGALDVAGSRSLTLPTGYGGAAKENDEAASDRVASSLGNIASMQEGLKLKARLCEEEEEASEEGAERRRKRPSSLSASNLLKAACEDDEDKASKQVSFKKRVWRKCCH